jgi:predicted nuclease of predicted toxin-antitoxin system
VKELGLTDEDDYKIFMEARRIGADAIFTLDSDFQMLWQLFGTPPKIIWLRVGNCSTQHLANIIIKHHNRIQEFLSSSEHDCLTILE